jgi:hypothetical protein
MFQRGGSFSGWREPWPPHQFQKPFRRESLLPADFPDQLAVAEKDPPPRADRARQRGLSALPLRKDRGLP